MYEARWNNYKGQCACADTIEEALGCILSLTQGDGTVFIYEIGEKGKVGECIKTFKIEG